MKVRKFVGIMLQGASARALAQETRSYVATRPHLNLENEVQAVAHHRYQQLNIYGPGGLGHIDPATVNSAVSAVERKILKELAS